MRDLAVAEPFGPELETAPLPLRQRPHDRTKPSYPLQPGEPFLRGDLAWRAAASDGRDRPTTPAIARSALKRQIARDPIQPPGEVRSIAVAGDVAPQGKEHFLDDVLTGSRIETERPDVAIHPVAVEAEQAQHQRIVVCRPGRVETEGDVEDLLAGGHAQPESTPETSCQTEESDRHVRSAEIP